MGQLAKAEFLLENLRRDYVGAVDSSELAKARLKELQAQGDNLPPLLLAFYAGFEALVAKHEWNPYIKLKLITKAVKRFDRAVEEEPKNAEIRFLRFSVEHYLPDFLKKSDHLEEDRRAIFQYFDTTPLTPESRRAIARFMKQSGRCGREEAKKYEGVMNEAP